MTIGIYLLSFNDLVYVGQSINIERRFKAHTRSFKNATASAKLLKAYNQYGDPILTIFRVCEEGPLNSLERETIVEFNSIEEGLNQIDGNTPGGSGCTASSSRYNKEQVLSIFDLLVEGYTRREVSKGLSIPFGTIGNIQSGTNHLWLKEEFPEEYDLMLYHAKKSKIKANTAKLQGRTYPPIISPLGVVYTDIESVAEFARKHSLDRSGLSRVLRGKYPVHLGWKLYNGS